MTPKKFNKEDNRKHFDFEMESLLEDEAGVQPEAQGNGGDSGSTLTDPKEVSPEQLRIDSLRLALKVIKLFDAVTAQDLLSVSSKISDFLINHKVGDDYDPNMLGGGDDADENEGESDENDDNYPNDTEEPTEEEENFEIPEDEVEDDEDLGLEDLDDEEEEGEAENEGSSEVPNEFFI